MIDILPKAAQVILFFKTLMGGIPTSTSRSRVWRHCKPGGFDSEAFPGVS